MKIAKWETFQGYRKTGPPWIKLHAGLIDKPEWIMLPVIAKAVLPVLWIAASRAGSSGELPDDSSLLSMLCHMQQSELDAALPALLAAGFILCDKTVANSATKPSQGPREIVRESRERERGETKGERETESCAAENTPPSPPLSERIDVDVDGARGLLREALEAARGKHPGLNDQQILDLPAYQAPSGPVRLETCQHAALMRATAGKLRRALHPPKRARGAPAWDRVDEEAEDLQARAAAWVKAHWAPARRLETMPAVFEALAGLSPPADLAGAIREHLVFGIYPHLRTTNHATQTPKEATHA